MRQRLRTALHAAAFTTLGFLLVLFIWRLGLPPEQVLFSSLSSFYDSCCALWFGTGVGVLALLLARPRITVSLSLGILMLLCAADTFYFLFFRGHPNSIIFSLFTQGEGRVLYTIFRLEKNLQLISAFVFCIGMTIGIYKIYPLCQRPRVEKFLLAGSAFLLVVTLLNPYRIHSAESYLSGQPKTLHDYSLVNPALNIYFLLHQHWKARTQCKSSAGPVEYPHSGSPLPRYKNVVVIFVESLSAEFGVNFSELIQRHPTTLVPLHLNSVGQWTHESLNTFWLWADTPQFDLQRLHWNRSRFTLPQFMADHGYHTRYLSGHADSWLQAGSVFPLLGFQEVLTESQLTQIFPQAPHVLMGIPDEYVFAEALRGLSAPDPQFTFVLTTTNHAPFEIPGGKPNSLLDMANESMRYTIESTKVFLESILTNPELAKNTLVLLVGDHRHPLLHRSETRSREVFSLLYVPPRANSPRARDFQIPANYDSIDLAFNFVELAFDSLRLEFPHAHWLPTHGTPVPAAAVQAEKERRRNLWSQNLCF